MRPRPARDVLALAGIAALALPGSQSLAKANPGGVPAVYATQAEAEQAAREHFHCSGAHRMGNQWMPCTSHGDASGSSSSRH